jgi:hypothetical protein
MAEFARWPFLWRNWQDTERARCQNSLTKIARWSFMMAEHGGICDMDFRDGEVREMAAFARWGFARRWNSKRRNSRDGDSLDGGIQNGGIRNNGIR